MSDDPGRLKIIFMGTPEFAVPVLDALNVAGHKIVGVYTQPDRPTGRGKRLQAPPVKQYAVEHGLPVFQPASLRRDEAARQELASLAPDLIVVAAYGLFLPVETFELPRLKTLNIHPSLLPQYRGSSPVSSAILNGDDVTGVTIIKLSEEMDAGDIAAQVETSIEPDETTDVLTERLFRTGADLLVDILPGWERGEIKPQPQDESQATFTIRLTREDGEIDWNDSSDRILRKIRAYHPWPGTFTHWDGKTVKIIEASSVADTDAPSPVPGEVVSLDGSIGVGTGEGIIKLGVVQMEGRRAVNARDFVQGYRDFMEAKLGG
jgi:methionyl-tRNA formyltransferase